MPRYQIKSITLDQGNAVFLPHGMEIAADTIKQAGQKIADNLFELAGLQVKGVSAIIRRDCEEAWEAEPEKPNLFSSNGEELPKARRGRPAGSKNKPKAIEGGRKRFDGLTYDG